MSAIYEIAQAIGVLMVCFAAVGIAAICATGAVDWLLSGEDFQ